MLKHQNKLITDYLTLNAVVQNQDSQDAPSSKEDAVYTFMCRKRFDQIQKDIRYLKQMISKIDLKNRAG